jgi:hypothetical protein
MQTTGNQTALVPAATFTDRNEAESNYHMKLGAAAVVNSVMESFQLIHRGRLLIVIQILV